MKNDQKFKAFLAIKNRAKEVKPLLRKYKINLNYKLISYRYDNNRESVKEKNQFMIPLNAQEITLLKDYKEDNKSDPIIDIISRGALPEQFESNTFLKYKNHFLKVEKEPSIEIKEFEEIIKPTENKKKRQHK